MFSLTPSLRALACTVLLSPALGAEWMTDLDAARAKAAAEGKAVLVDFTGSDWCGPCIHLRRTVLDTPAFEAYAQDRFVLVEIDVPRNPAFDPELLRRNKELCTQYRVGGFPTLMVLTPEGQLAGGFVGGGMSLKYIHLPLDAALANIPAVRAAEKMEGEAQLRALYALYRSMQKDLAGSLRDRIAALDTGNITGIHDEIRAEAQMSDFRKKYQACARQDAASRIAMVDEALATALPQNRAQMLKVKMGLQIQSAQTVEDVVAARDTLLEMAEASPKDAVRLRKMAEERFGDPEMTLRALRLSRETLQKEQEARERQKGGE